MVSLLYAREELYGEIPSELEDYVTPIQWRDICAAFRSSEEEESSRAWFYEWIFCLVTGLLCIFCLHPWIYRWLTKRRLQRRLQAMNGLYFNGRPVLIGTKEGGLRIDTDFVQLSLV